jgi:hypothetical protein
VLWLKVNRVKIIPDKINQTTADLGGDGVIIITIIPDHQDIPVGRIMITIKNFGNGGGNGSRTTGGGATGSAT